MFCIKLHLPGICEDNHHDHVSLPVVVVVVVLVVVVVVAVHMVMVVVSRGATTCLAIPPAPPALLAEMQVHCLDLNENA